MIDAREISLGFGARTLFNKLSFQLGDQERLCLAGRNGTGKTTLLKILFGELQPDAGKVIRSSGERIGFLRQHPGNLNGATAYEAALSSFDEALAAAEELEELQHAFGRGEVSDAQLERLDVLQDTLIRTGYYTAESETRSVLAGLGFSTEEQEKPLSSLSGGWAMRVALAQVLLRKPTCLFLDEPTNHLDLDSILWLEEWIRTHDGSMILISHDRRFVDRTCNRLIEIEGSVAVDYPLPYHRYEEERELRALQQLKAYSKQQDEVERLERFIERFKAKASKATQAKSKQKQLNRIDRIEIDSAKPTLKLRFPEAPPSGAFVFEAENLSKSYDDHMIFQKCEFAIRAADKMVLTGPNGAGKTTLLRLLLGIEKQTGGDVRTGHNVKVGYFAQYEEPSAVDLSQTLVEFLVTAHPKASELEIRTLLGAMLFSDDDAFKKYSVLSGGERSRLRLCRLLMTACNVLVLDEPTNHLDVVSKDLLMQAMIDFSGTVIFVSHDREFVENVATRVIQVRSGKVTEYPGDWEYYLQKLDEDRKRARAEEMAEAKKGGGSQKSNKNSENTRNSEVTSSRNGIPSGLAKSDATHGKPSQNAGKDSGSGKSAASGQEAGASAASQVSSGGGDREERKEADRRRRKDEKRRDELVDLIAKTEHRIMDYDAELCKEEVFSQPGELSRVQREKQHAESELATHFAEWEDVEARLGV